MRWRCRDHVFDLADRTLVMGIVNVTPDSFSDGGRTLEPRAAAERARRLFDEGAGLVDLGAESTRPGAAPVPAAEQIRRLAPVLEALAGTPGIAISIDTSSAEVAAHGLAAGACAVNDVTALRDPAMAQVVAERGAGLVLMHMRGTPATMQADPRYDDVAAEVAAHLAGRLEAARGAGVDEACVALDPGIGFGKTARHNFELVARIDRLAALGRPVLVGVSRKSFLAGPEPLAVDERLEAGLAATAVAVFMGARIVRTHDVAATLRAVRIADALRAARAGPAAAPGGRPVRATRTHRGTA
ncbi:MAG TPA: dihydropteroate synthase [Candidatus Eisenbacteria bacterium]